MRTPRHVVPLPAGLTLDLSNAVSIAPTRRPVHGHPFDEANTHITPNGHRKCRICNREGQRTRKGALERRAEREGWEFGQIAPLAPEPPTRVG